MSSSYDLTASTTSLIVHFKDQQRARARDGLVSALRGFPSTKRAREMEMAIRRLSKQEALEAQIAALRHEAELER